jgi:hypothetical protein
MDNRWFILETIYYIKRFTPFLTSSTLDIEAVWFSKMLQAFPTAAVRQNPAEKFRNYNLHESSSTPDFFMLPLSSECFVPPVSFMKC